MRLYENNFLQTLSFLLRFAKPADLQNFLLHVADIKIFGSSIRARLFYEDADKSHLRPGSLLTKGITPSNFVRHNDQYFRDRTGTKSLVMVEGIPSWITMGTITYSLMHLMSEEKFEWAYEWQNRPGTGQLPEKNAFPISTGYNLKTIYG